jgi:hypothetical protein
MKFTDKDLFNKYLKISKEILVTSLKSQSNKNFEIALLIFKDDEDFVKEYLGIDFIGFQNPADFYEYAINGKFNIQTRHDMDDYMSPDYVEKIQEEYDKNIKIYDKFLIQSQPIMMMYQTKEETQMGKYHDKRNSMFLSLCQKYVTNHIFERKHGSMWEITENVISLPEGYTKWVIHGENISIKKNMIK